MWFLLPEIVIVVAMAPTSVVVAVASVSVTISATMMMMTVIEISLMAVFYVTALVMVWVERADELPLRLGNLPIISKAHLYLRARVFRSAAVGSLGDDIML